MEIVGYFGALLIGMILGLVGGGGSILMVPLLVYILDVDPILATAYSLFVVGATSTFGSIKNSLRKLVDYKIGIIFSIPSFLAVFISRKYLMPSIPDHLISIGVYEITKEAGIMIFFGLLMLSASYFMLKQHKEVFSSNKKHNLNFLLIFIEGFVIGIITGLVGAGGGFLIIPALVLLAKLSIKKAIATSLFIISIKSLFGFLGDVGNLEINWLFLSLITCVAVIGIFFGNNLNYYMKGKALKKGFAGLVFVMGVFVIAYEVYNL